MIADRLARAVVRRYPRTWRQRYEREVLALFVDAPPTAAHVVDLARGCCAEWGRTIRARRKQRKPRPVLAPLACAVAVRILSTTMDIFWGAAPPSGRLPLELVWAALIFVVIGRATPALVWGPARPRLRMGEIEAVVVSLLVLLLAVFTDWAHPASRTSVEFDDVGPASALLLSLTIPAMTFNLLSAILAASPFTPADLRRQLRRPPPSRPLGL